MELENAAIETETPIDSIDSVVADPLANPVETDEAKGLKAAASEERKKRQIIEREAQSLREKVSQLESATKKESYPADIDAIVDKRLAQREEERKQAEKVSSRQNKLKAWEETKPQAQERLEMDLDAAVDTVGTFLAGLGQPGLDLADDIMESDVSWDVIAHLQSTPDDLEKFQGMTPLQMGKALARIEAQAKSPTKPEGRKVTSAPDPIRPVRSTVSPDVDLDKMSPADYEQFVMKQRGGSVFPRSE